ncbi:hypothetical protein FQZ97_1062880 [compost metagenome]
MQAAVDGQGLLPVDPSLQRQGLLGLAGKLQPLDVRPLGIHPARKGEGYRAALAR